MKEVNTLNSVSVTPDDLINNKKTTYDFQITPATGLVKDDQILVQFPPEIKVDDTVECIDRVGQFLKCEYESQNKVLITVNRASNTDKFTFLMSNVLNPSTSKPLDSMEITLMNNDGIKMAQTSGKSIAIKTEQSSTFKAFQFEVRPLEYDLGKKTTYDVLFTPSVVEMGMVFDMKLPPKIEIDPERNL